jgi:hypothetical protein
MYQHTAGGICFTVITALRESALVPRPFVLTTVAARPPTPHVHTALCSAVCQPVRCDAGVRCFCHRCNRMCSILILGSSEALSTHALRAAAPAAAARGTPSKKAKSSAALTCRSPVRTHHAKSGGRWQGGRDDDVTMGLAAQDGPSGQGANSQQAAATDPCREPSSRAPFRRELPPVCLRRASRRSGAARQRVLSCTDCSCAGALGLARGRRAQPTFS